ncbi:unnamed protein product [Caenorhabditis bovis]|uniref:Globin domain-containing protein n=1 Tax=Caenorhabditis bovis TaxID=2654633 RepID=A0A8S1EC68_9PELO|nr:unnamed protein product [Caenorhabditis bovis]
MQSAPSGGVNNSIPYMHMVDCDEKNVTKKNQKPQPSPMYAEYRQIESESRKARNLVTEAITNVIDSVDIDTLSRTPSDFNKDDGSEETDVELLYDGDEVEDDYELARTHWIQLHKSNKQNLVLRSCFLVILDQYPHTRPIWTFGKRIEESEKDWKAEFSEDFYFRHHCATLQAAINLILKSKDDVHSFRRMLNEMGAHHFFYDACEPHFDVFQECFIKGMKLVLNGPEALDDEIEASWNSLLRTIKIHIAEGIAIQRVNYLSQCLIPKEMEEVRENWAKVMEFGYQKAGDILCDVAFKSYTHLLKEYNLRMYLPPSTKRGTPAYEELSMQIMRAIGKTIESYTKEDGFCGLIEQIREFVVKFLIVDVCPPLIRRALIDGLVQMLSIVLDIEHVREDFVHIWKKVYRVMEQSMIANIIDY